MAEYTNADGLTYHFGDTEANSTYGGIVSDGVRQKLVIDFDYSELGATASAKVMSEAVIPVGAYLVSATLTVTTAFAGATADLSVGLVQASDRSTDIGTADVGLIAATDIALIDAVGDTITGAGDALSTVLANSALVTMTETTAAFTAGAGRLEVEYYHTS